MIRKFFFSILILFLTTLVGCGNEAKESSSDKQDGPKLLKIANTAPVTTWDPSISYSTEVAYLANIYEPLIWADGAGDGSSFKPGLAEEWSSNEDGTVWTFKIREGVTFHDGAELNAEAVKSSIQRTIDIGKGASFIWDAVEEIKTPDEFTVEFNLSKAVPFERMVSSASGAYIMSPNLLDKDEEWFNKGNAGGTGAWKLSSYKPGEEIIFDRNEEFWGETGSPYEKVVVKIVPEGLVQQQMLTSGEVDIATSIPVENLDELESNDNIALKTVPTFYNFLGFFNTTKAPLDDKRVRQALSYAIPYEDVITIATRGAGKQSHGPVPQGLWPSDPSLKAYEENLDKARELLDEAGVDPTTLKLTLTHAAENESEKRFSELIKESFAELGVELEIQPLLWNQQWEKAKADPSKAQDIFVLMWWPSYPDGYDNMKAMFTTEEEVSWNLGYWYNEKFDKTLGEAHVASATDLEKSKKLYMEAQNMLIEEAPAIYFYDAEQRIPVNSSLKGEFTNPYYTSVIFFDKIRVE